MKKSTLLLFFCCIVLFLSTLSSCEKDESIATRSKDQLIVGNWEINRIQLKIFQGGVFVKDTILKQNPRPKNYVMFGSGGNFEYKWNLEATDKGTYQLKGADSIITNAIPDAHRFKLLMLTEDLLTLKTTCTDEPMFTGSVVEKYYTLIR
ncbi:MAG: hypothetical protein KA319_02355 [Ferruginibacter sp.]|nr:hypothetical protein [Ferruginibacter sp.]